MSEDLADRIEALDAKATAGEWLAPRRTSVIGSGIIAAPVGRMVGDIFEHDNAALIVALRNAVPEILAALRKAETPSPDVAGLVERLRTHNGLPSTFDMVGDNVEPLFDPGNRHKSGKKPFDFLKSWLSMLRPFAYATADESWGELEKLLCIVMRNYIRRSRLLTEAADTLTAQAHLIAKLEAVMERCAVIVDRNLYHQHEKVEDVPKLLRNAIKGGRDD